MRRKAELTERLLLTCGLLIVGGWMGWSLYSDHSQIWTSEQQRLATQATVIDENLGRQLIGVDHALTSIRDDLPYLESQANGGKLVNHRLQSLTSAIPGVRTIQVLDQSGNVIASNRENIIGLNFAWREYFITARQSNNPATLYVSPPFDTVPVGAFAMNLVRVITDARGGFAGIVSATLDPTYFNTLLNSVTYAPDMWASLTHADGKLFLIVPEQNIPAGSDLAKPGSLFMRHMESGQTATVLTGKVLATGEERVAARRTVHPAALPMDKPLLVAVTRDLNVLFAPWRRGAYLQGGWFALLVLMTNGGLFLYQKRQRELARFAALREQERIRYQSILKMASDGIHIVDRDGLLLEANEAFLRILGYDETAIGILRIPDWDVQDPWDVIKARIEDLISNRTRMVFETQHRRRDGVIVDIEINASGIEIDGKGYLCAASRDITDRKAMEEELRRSNAELEQFAYVASHDLRSPLRAVNSYLSLIKRKLGAEIDPELEEFIKFAVGGAKRMDNLIIGLLEYSRAGRTDKEFESVSLEDALQESLLNLVAVIEDASASVTLADGLPTITGDRTEVVRLFQNLIGNALKYHSPDRVPCVAIGWQVKKQEWLIWVRDNGIGIAQKDFERCFGIFQRLVTQDGYEGTGIGLAVCKKIVEHHDGRIWIESEVGVGSTFFVTFPATEQ